MKYKGILKMNKDNIYDFVIDNNFTHRMNRAFFNDSDLADVYIIFFLLYIYFECMGD